MFPELVEKLVSIDAVKQYSPPVETLSPRMKGVLTQFHELVSDILLSFYFSRSPSPIVVKLSLNAHL